MLEFFRSVVAIAIPVFVVSTMLNVGLTQRPSKILSHLKHWQFVAKMVVANFVIAPLLMILILGFMKFSLPVQAGLLIFSLGAGAPFLIKLTQTAEQDMSLGAAMMLLLVVLTVPFMPLVLPRFLDGLPVDAGAIASTLLQQMVLPIVIGMLAARFARGIATKVQPWVAKLGNVALYVVIGATFIGYFPNMVDLLGTGALLAGLVFIVGSFGAGYLAGRGRDQLEDVGGLATAQRNTAAALTVAQNFTNPDVLVVITMVSTVGIVLLLFLARRLTRDNAWNPAPPRASEKAS